MRHGGDIAGYELEYGTQPLDFSSNPNPLGMPPAAREAIASAATRASAYPDPLCRKLRKAIAEAHGMSAGCIMCGNGAADIIFRLALAVRPETALVLAPTFSEYEASLEVVGASVRHHELLASEGFELRDDILPKLTSDVDVCYICNPNNPTGKLVDKPLMMQIADACCEHGTLLVVDECFMGFVDDSRRYTLRHLATQPVRGGEGGIVVLDAFTKLFGMAGVRLGYCICGDEALLERMSKVGQPWAVSSIAQEAGVAALEQSDRYLRQTRQLVHGEREWLQGELCSLGLDVLQGAGANYIFFSCACEDLAQRMRERGVLIRDCGNYVGLCPGTYRVGVRDRASNERLVAALRDALGML